MGGKPKLFRGNGAWMPAAVGMAGPKRGIKKPNAKESCRCLADRINHISKQQHRVKGRNNTGLRGKA